MKRLDNLYEKMLDFNNIKSCYNEVMRNTKNKRSVVRYDSFRCSHIYKIYTMLKNRNYHMSSYNIFSIYEPKYRIIVSMKLTDKVVNHLVTRCILMPAIIPALIDQNVATRPGMGTSKGVQYYKKYRQTFSQKYGKYYILKCDIKKYFHSIDHEVLKQMLEKRIKDKDALNIVNMIIDSYPNGLPIGNMSSQMLAIFYLNDLDHYIKEELKIKGYIRYQDDFLLFHQDKEYLKECLIKIEKYLNNKLKLELNQKTRIYSSKEKLIFIGNNKGKGPIKKKLSKRKRQYEKGYITLNSYVASIMTYKGKL